jgi:hypothetical protein
MHSRKKENRGAQICAPLFGYFVVTGLERAVRFLGQFVQKLLAGPPLEPQFSPASFPLRLLNLRKKRVRRFARLFLKRRDTLPEPQSLPQAAVLTRTTVVLYKPPRIRAKAAEICAAFGLRSFSMLLKNQYCSFWVGVFFYLASRRLPSIVRATSSETP